MSGHRQRAFPRQRDEGRLRLHRGRPRRLRFVDADDIAADLDRAIADGAEDRSDTVQRLTGQPPHSFRAFAERELTPRGSAVGEA
ncbi:hypothetical protein ACFV80_31680 [Streptomyces sp. NPDC059862]|uniref:hypothetical protein n=1 Tax=Streptomyces sp. NPDC059862 TaxID=3346975 RepID=UPI00366262DD